MSAIQAGIGRLAIAMMVVAAGGQMNSAARAAEPVQPNIVFIIVDDMGYADLGSYGQDAYATPNLDRLAGEGMRFTQAYSGCAVCAPARSSLMTGQHLGHTPVRGNTGGIPLPDEAVTVAEVLQKAGYATGGFGKWGVGDIRTEGAAEKQGFDTFFGYYDQVHAHDYYPDYLILDGEHYPLKDRQFSHYLILERMKRFIRENRNRPFFCYAPWTPPHVPYDIPRDDPAWRAVEDKPWPDAAKGHASFNIMIDRHVGQVLDLLEELGVAGRTMVIFCSDNGPKARFEGTLDSSGPLRGYKRAMYEGGLRVPMIVRWPGVVAAGSVSDLPTYFPDVMPTLAEVAGAAEHVPDDIDGLSIVPTLRGDAPGQERHAYMYWESPWYRWKAKKYTGQMQQALRMGDWKILRYDSGKPWQLYNLAKDVSERNDLAAEHPDRVKRMAEVADKAHTPMPPQIEPEADGRFR